MNKAWSYEYEKGKNFHGFLQALKKMEKKGRHRLHFAVVFVVVDVEK